MSEARRGSRTLSAATTLAVVMAGTVIAVTAPAQAGAVPSPLAGSAAVSAKTALRCGDTITADTTLHADLVDCPGNGIVIGADNITLDLNGHTIDGDDALSECPAGTDCDVGVANFDGHDGVSVVGGRVRQFRLGVLVEGGAARNRLRRLVATDNTGIGIAAVESTGSVIEKNSLRDNNTGLALIDSRDALVTGNTSAGGSGFGIVLVRAEAGTIERNLFDGNDEGIGVYDSSHNTVRRNKVSHHAGAAIDLRDNATANRVQDNRLTDNGDGITLQEVAGNLISGNLVTGTGFFGAPETGGFGIVLDGGSRNTVDRNTVTGGRGPAVLVATLDAASPPESSVISRNLVNSKQYDGIFVDSTAMKTVIERNTANRSGHDGIHVDAPTTTLTRNIADNNHNLGIEAAPGVIDGGGNHASHNGNAAQCTYVAC
ncbi:right-handed parallel beta-helix repeat-containing protein [Kribbella sp. NPDC006257]|uniref:right-handed parallel beta-helix repeat-containing protein n=1 Tax=Kribbella sp. NPDC006257 TaxID=3156738 RepID=UPI0033B89AFF